MSLPLVMPGLVPGIHAFAALQKKTWLAGTSPAMTKKRDCKGNMDAGAPKAITGRPSSARL